jgi:N4-gp56 family major capsid protein
MPQNYQTAAGRINKLKGEILGHAIPVEVLGVGGGMNKPMPKNSSDTVVFRRWLPFGGTDNKWIVPTTTDAASNFAAAHLTVEGVTPNSDTLAPVDVTVTLNEYAALYSLSNRTADLHEDDIPAEMKKQTGQRIGLVREMVRFGALKACTNKFYGGGGTTRASVNSKITLPFLRKISRSLNVNHADQITSILSAGPNFGTSPVEAGYLVFGHTDLAPDIRDLPGFTKVAEYANRKPISPKEIGSCEDFRFILSPELAPILDAGVAVGATGLLANSTNVDVYPVVVMADNCYGQVALRGMDSVNPTYIPPGQKDKNDPLGQRGYIGAMTYYQCIVLNNGWMAIGEVGASQLS